MVAIAATNTATPSVQATMGRVRREQARRDANQAEVNAQALRARADEAERDAQSSQNRLRELGAISQQPDATYSPQKRSSQSETSSKPLDLPPNLYGTSNQTRVNDGHALKSNAYRTPLESDRPIALGRVIDLSA